MTLSVGDAAPEFTLPDQDKQSVSLADLRGTPVLLVFYPFAFSGLCTGELCQLRDELAVYTDAGVKVLAVSTDPVVHPQGVQGAGGLRLPAAQSDFWPHGAVAQAYGAFNDKAGMAAARARSWSTPRARSPSPRSTRPATCASSRAGRTPSASWPPDPVSGGVPVTPSGIAARGTYPGRAGRVAQR